MALLRIGNVSRGSAPSSPPTAPRSRSMSVRRRKIGADVIVELSGQGVCEHASFSTGGVTYHVLAVPDPGVSGIAGPDGSTGFVPLVIMAAKGAGAALTGHKPGEAAAATAAAATAPLVVNADGSMIVPVPPAGFSWRQVAVAPVAAANPAAVSGFDLANVFRKPANGGGFAGKPAQPAPAVPATTYTLPAPAPGMAWRLVDAAGNPPTAPKRDNLPLASLLRRGVDVFRRKEDGGDEDGLLDSAVGFDPWAYDTEGKGVNVQTGRAGPSLDFRGGQYRPGEGGR